MENLYLKERARLEYVKVNNLKYSNMSILDYLAYSETVNNINVLPPRVYALDSYIESLDRGFMFKDV